MDARPGSRIKGAVTSKMFPIVKSVLDTKHAVNDDNVGRQRQLFDRSHLEHGTIFYMRNPNQPRELLVCRFVIIRHDSLVLQDAG